MTSLNVNFSEEIERLILDGYKEKHGREFNTTKTIQYFFVPEYIKLGKKVRRREKRKDFFQNWGTVIIWIVAILGVIGWSTYDSTQMETTSSPKSDYSTGTSRIHYGEVCPVTTCNDGACSRSTGRGTCSHHSGVRY